MAKDFNRSTGSRANGFSSKLPLWYQIANRLRSEILGGHLPPGGRIEPEIRLAEDYGVSVVPVRQALRALEAEALIVRRRGSGTFVSSKPSARDKGATSLRDLYSTEFSKPALILERSEVEIPPNFLPYFSGETVIHAIRRVAFRDAVPWSFGTLYVPVRYADALSTVDLQRYPLYRLLQERHGIYLARSHFEAMAVAIGEEAAHYLEIGPYEPALSLTCVTFDGADRAVGAFDMTFPNDPFVFKFDTEHGLGDDIDLSTPLSARTRPME
ncbi:GntR family transcriptional regulator [Sphingobium sp. MK2]|uniref:GntR family transcriptional regulator n=1 Tax=Sphingobium sp. MK2 TaxID=3116540 RepID=UPI0032E36215